MREMRSSAAFTYAIGAFFAYWAVAFFVPIEIIREIFNSLSLGVAIMVALTWAPAAWHAMRSNNRAGEWQLIIAIFLSFCVLTLQRLYAMAVAILNRPDWLVNSPIAGFIPYSITVVGVLFLVAPGVYRGSTQGEYWWHIVIAVGIGSLIAGILLGRVSLG